MSDLKGHYVDIIPLWSQSSCKSVQQRQKLLLSRRHFVHAPRPWMCACLIFCSAVLLWVICGAGGLCADLLWATAETFSLCVCHTDIWGNTHTPQQLCSFMHICQCTHTRVPHDLTELSPTTDGLTPSLRKGDVLTSSASWSARCCMSDSSLRMSASSAMAAGFGGWRRSPTAKRRS